MQLFVCVANNCKVDSDCGCGYCSPSVDPTCTPAGDVDWGVFGYCCHTPQDTCVNDTDCGTSTTNVQGFCAYSPEIGHWACSYTPCVT